MYVNPLKILPAFMGVHALPEALESLPVFYWPGITPSYINLFFERE